MTMRDCSTSSRLTASGPTLIVEVAIARYALRTGWEIVMTPMSDKLVNLLNRKEHENCYDRNSDFNPFRIRM